MGGSKPWPQVSVGNKDHTNAAVVIIGAGISGMCMAIDLIRRNKCHNFIILEKSSAVGGTWHDNKYPGCCCDVSSHLYSYSFEQNPDWSRVYPGQEEILDYLIQVAQKYKLYKYIRFNTSVEQARWDDSELKWKTDVKVSGDKDSEFSNAYTIISDFLISAVGQLNQPAYPDIPGLGEFGGKIMHSARWDWSYDLEGKRIAVIGNGATAAQLLPELTRAAASITLFQRTPNWVMPRLDAPIPSLLRTAFRYLPPLLWRTRALQMDMREDFYAVTDSDSNISNQIRGWCSDAMRAAFPNQPKVWKKLTPEYAPGCKRVIISDEYYPALASPNCHLETRPIARITKTRIEVGGTAPPPPSPGTSSGTEELDLIVLATGFRTTEFLSPITITGAHGRALSQIWEESGGATALYGTTIPQLPNFGVFYGPNTNLGHNSIVLMIEAQSRYLAALVATVLDARGAGRPLALVPREERVREFNAEIQERLGRSSFADERCRSWYKNSEGRITNNWSGTVVEYQEVLSKVDWGDFEQVGEETGKSGSGVTLGGKKETRLGRVREETVVGNTALVVGGAVAAAAVVGGVVWGRRRGGRRWW
ncbi:flavin-binding monooxygenase-like protein [Mytilinidion resinicola]|uniref:Flavin-binding monooxygenase-like protein n=1 Tax=Mytilinidion resinicola TaxID=574789 RepID=A0A6A6Y600_9PEZI|nr:flavin-binding monooxygenase-like protein [Mytilinidion resinicola]KAF2803953.1 flavin-binding monooxygenase-like protein [Mytilinidion resinicola]